MDPFVHWLTVSLRGNPELALFLTLAVGYALGLVRLGAFRLGPVLGTLIAGLVVGQIGIQVPAAMKGTFFLMFLFAIGYRTGPEFFRGLRTTAGPQVVLTVLLCALAVGFALVFGRALGLDGGRTAGLLAGATTSSTALGTATRAATTLRVPPAVVTDLAAHIATAYALTYVLGTILVIWFLPAVGPLLMRVDLKRACRELETQMGLSVRDGTLGSAYREFAVRAFRLPPGLEGRTVAEIEALWPSDRRVVVSRIRRGDLVIDGDPGVQLVAGDIVGVAGRAGALIGQPTPLGAEVDDRELLDVPTVSAELVLTQRRLAGQPLEALARTVGARGVFLRTLKRGGQVLPFTAQTIIERGDVMAVSGLQADINRIAAEVGFADYPTSATDLLTVAAAIVVGGLVGLPAIRMGQVDLSLSVPVGVLLAGLTLGYLRSVNPRFGRFPDASQWIFESLGLAGFLAAVGLAAGPDLVAAFRQSGPLLLGAGVAVTLLPHLITILVGRYVVRLHPGILLGVCAGAGTSAPALAELEKAAGSRIPAFGYGMACAVGNVLMAIAGTVIVLLSHT